MLSFLLDEHISPEIAEQIARKRPSIPVFVVASWQEGRLLGMPDELLLEAAAEASLTLVTYDQKTIPPILCEWGEAGRTHGGVIFVDYQSIPPSNFGGLVRALIWLWDTQHTTDWKNRLVYLQPSP
ncbi:MAG: DUF5615 family PIN-like protein [Xenococcaceae cyanobacterium]